MRQNISAEWSRTNLIVFRLFFTYLTLYFLFISNFFTEKFSLLHYVHAPFEYISKALVGFVDSTFLHREFDGYLSIGGIGFFVYVQIFCYLIIAIIITIAWSILDKRRSHPTLFKYLHTYARYYLAFALLSYGLWKLTMVQFPTPWPELLISPLGNLRPFILFWNFMGSSSSYQFFAGLMEVIPAVLLLFRRTSTLGALIAVGVLVNVLMLNIGYEVPVIPFLIHLLLIAIFIINSDLKKLYDIFVLHRTQSLSVIPVAIGHNRHRWLRYGLKISLVAFVMFAFLKEINEVLAYRFDNRTIYSLHGIFDVKEFYLNGQSLPPLATDSVRWNKVAISGIGSATVVHMNDSYQWFNNIKVDTIEKVLELSEDSTIKCKLHYTLAKPNEYIFEGICKNDSIHFVAEKVDLTKLPLLKDRNKVRWTW